jgi:hypothetical protein
MSSLGTALDDILENARLRYEDAVGQPCLRRSSDESTCRPTCDCRKCFTHFYYADQPPGAVRTACASGPECPRFRELHTVLHTASAAKHIELLMDAATATGFLDPSEVFGRRDAVIASFGCGGAADLIGCLSWADKTYEAYAANSARLRGCDAVDAWFDLGTEAVAFAVGDTAPWTRGVYYEFAAVPRVPTDSDLMMLDDADVVLFSWVLSILDQEGILDETWRGIVSHLRAGAVVVVTDRWQPGGFNLVLERLLGSSPRLQPAWGVGDYDQRLMDYRFTPAVRTHMPRGKFRASGVVARVH